MVNKSNSEFYFHYSYLLRQVNQYIIELATQSRSNPSYKHIWQVYQKVIDLEHNEREITNMLFDTMPQLPSELDAHWLGAGKSQDLLNDRDGILILQKAGNANESVMRKLRILKELAIRASSSTLTEEQLKMLEAQRVALLIEIDRIANTTEYNGFKLTNVPTSIFNIQVGLNNMVTNFSNGVSISTYDLTSSIGLDLGTPPTYDDPGDINFSTVIDAGDAIPRIAKAINIVARYITKNGTYVNILRSAKDKTHDDIYSKAKSLETSLRGVVGYLKRMTEYYLSISSKRDIPSSLH